MRRADDVIGSPGLMRWGIFVVQAVNAFVVHLGCEGPNVLLTLRVRIGHHAKREDYNADCSNAMKDSQQPR